MLRFPPFAVTYVRVFFRTSGVGYRGWVGRKNLFLLSSCQIGGLRGVPQATLCTLKGWADCGNVAFAVNPDRSLFAASCRRHPNIADHFLSLLETYDRAVLYVQRTVAGAAA